MSVWRHRDLRVIAVSRAASFLGDEVAVVALTLLAYSRGWGTSGVAAMLAVSALPLVLAAPLAGRLVDRHDSRTLVAWSAVWQACCVVLLAVLVGRVGAGRAGEAAILAALFALNAGQAVSGPAWTALVPHVVTRGETGRAMALLQVLTTLAAVSGPALGGALVAWRGTGAALLVDAVSFALLAVAGLLVHTRRRPSSHDGQADGGAWAGVVWLRREPVCGSLVLGVLSIVLCVQLVIVVEVFLVRGSLGAGAAAYGTVGAVTAAAMVLGSLAGGRVSHTAERVRATILSLSVIAAAVVAGGLAHTIWFFAASMAVVGLANGVLNVTFQAVILERTPDAVRGRVVAAVMGAIQACTFLGMILGGVAGAFATPRQVFVGAGSLGLVVSGVVLAVLRARVSPDGEAPDRCTDASDVATG